MRKQCADRNANQCDKRHSRIKIQYDRQRTDKLNQCTNDSRKEADNAVLTVADTGIGIPPEDIDNVFERFYVVDKSRNKNISSTGLGLSIVKHIVKLHGGNISVRSTLGNGAVFTAILPGIIN